jgi:ABC-type oligopeptide transport system ATPase subunit
MGSNGFRLLFAVPRHRSYYFQIAEHCSVRWQGQGSTLSGRQLGEDGTTMIVVTHEIAFARDIAAHVLFMDAGVIAEHGPADEVLVRPANPRTRAFLSRFHHAGALRYAG